MKPIIRLSQEEVEAFEQMEATSKLLHLLECCQSDESASSALNALAPANWQQFSYESFDAYRAISKDERLCEALDLWKSGYEAKKQQEQKSARWDAFFKDRISKLTTAFGDTFPKNALVSSSNGCLLHIELSPVLGFVLTYRTVEQINIPKDALMHIEQTSAFKISVDKPRIYARSMSVAIGKPADAPLTKIIGINSKVHLAVAEGNKKIIFLASRERHMLQLDFEEKPDGMNSSTSVTFAANDGTWEATLSLNEDSRYLSDKEYFSLMASSNDKTQLGSLTIKGPAFLSFDKDLFLSFLFFATQAEYVPIESQYVDNSDAIVGVEVAAYRELRPQWCYAIRSNWMMASQLVKIWNQISSLPLDSTNRFSQTHFKILIHSIISLLRQPLQKAIVDCYQVLDTMAKLHPDVPRTKMDQATFALNKNLQTKLIDRLRSEIDSSGDPMHGPQSISALDTIKNMVDNQKNDFSVVQSVLSLLKACSIVYDKKNPTQKLALDLRHKISHNLASVQVKEDNDPDPDKYTIRQLVDVKKQLLIWMFRCIEDFLRPKGDASPSLIFSTEPQPLPQSLLSLMSQANSVPPSNTENTSSAERPASPTKAPDPAEIRPSVQDTGTPGSFIEKPAKASEASPSLGEHTPSPAKPAPYDGAAPSPGDNSSTPDANDLPANKTVGAANRVRTFFAKRFPCLWSRRDVQRA